MFVRLAWAYSLLLGPVSTMVLWHGYWVCSFFRGPVSTLVWVLDMLTTAGTHQYSGALSAQNCRNHQLALAVLM